MNSIITTDGPFK